VNICDHGAVPGVDISAAANAALAAGDGFVPAGDWLVNASLGILLDQPGMVLEMHPNARVWVIPCLIGGYSAITVTAPGCKLIRPRITGDVITHLGTTGEWGHGISILAGGNGCIVEDADVRQCWGDGIYIGGGVTDIVLIRGAYEENRRNGLSATGVAGLKIDGGKFNRNGTINGTSPKGGICLEPNPLSGLDVVEFSVNGVDCNFNAGAGINLVRANGQGTRGKVSNSTAAGNAGPGVMAAGAAGSMMVDLTGMTLSYNLHGVQATALGLNLDGGHIYSNTQNGVLATAKVKLKGVTVDYNQRGGVVLAAGADDSSILGSEVSNNSTSATGTYAEVDIAAAKCALAGGVILPASGGNRASWAVVVRSTGTKATVNGVTMKSGTAGYITAIADTVQSSIIKT
jgi:hypothetical protein